jgi:predicted  nucleic acid-binding Zn-ribbon protein
MQRCIECGNSVNDTDKMCTACRLAEWRHFQYNETEKRLKREALESHRDAYLGRKKAVRDSIRAGVVTAVSLMLFLAFLSATCDAMRYEWQTKPALLRAQGVR